MKNLIKLLLVGGVLSFASCSKNADVAKNEFGTSDAEMLKPAQFKKEIEVSDESGKNTAYVALFADEEGLIDAYLAAHDLSLSVYGTSAETLVEEESRPDLKVGENTEISEKQTKEAPEGGVTIEVVHTNLADGVVSYSLDVKSSELKLSIWDYSRSEDWTNHYITKDDYIGITHQIDGETYLVWKKYTWSWLGKWYSYDYFLSYGDYIQNDQPNSYKVGFTIQRLPEDKGSMNYKIYYNKNFMRGTTCDMGYKRSNKAEECYVGAAPVGTEPFIWGKAGEFHNFYYTPASGSTKCPVAGSYFDGSNCFYKNIPSHVNPYTWDRFYYVKTNYVNNKYLVNFTYPNNRVY